MFPIALQHTKLFVCGQELDGVRKRKRQSVPELFMAHRAQSELSKWLEFI